MRFELAAADGRSDLMPELRPGAKVTAKRCRHGLRAIRPALERMGLDLDLDETDPIAAAREVCRTVLGSLTEPERRTLQLTALPVSLVHDEYMFIRALQSYETTFALFAVQLAAAAAAIDRGDAAAATAAIEAAAEVLGEASPIWSLVGTMQTEAFLKFREYTDGASAIQSRNYKLFEATCRRPEQARLDSPAYESVPEVREVVLAGRRNIDDALSAAGARPRRARGRRRGHGALRSRRLQVAQDPPQPRLPHARRPARHRRHRGRALPGGGAHDPGLQGPLPVRARRAAGGRRLSAPTSGRLERQRGDHGSRLRAGLVDARIGPVEQVAPVDERRRAASVEVDRLLAAEADHEPGELG